MISKGVPSNAFSADANSLTPDLRISAEDGRIYSYDEFCAKCKEWYSEHVIQQYWENDCQPLSHHPVGIFLLDALGLIGTEEKRRDLADGELRTRRELQEHYRSEYSEVECE